MTIAYFDPSALLKLFFAEPGSATARRACRAAATIASSRLLYAEARAALAAAARDPVRRFGKRQLSRAKENLAEAWIHMVKVDAGEPVIQVARDLAETRALRGYDVVHLESALRVSVDALVSSDAGLLRAAAACGVGVIDVRQ